MTNGAYAIGYVRVSTDEQAWSGLGLEAQRLAVRDTAARLGLTVRDVFSDAGVSGALALSARPTLLQAVTACGRGATLVVAKRDRLGRDLIEVAMIERLMVKRGARIISAAGEGTENDEPSSMLLRRFIDLFAEYERLVIKSRTTAALTVKRARGERTGTLPFGFQLAPDGVQLEPAPVEQRITAHIASLKAACQTTREITDALNARGYRTRRGTPWRHQYVSRLLKRSA